MFTLFLNTASNCKSVSVGLSMVTGDKPRLVTPPTFPSVKVDAIYNSQRHLQQQLKIFVKYKDKKECERHCIKLLV